jgi:hypothetical protein
VDDDRRVTMSDFLDKAKDLAGDHADKVKEGIDKATDLADEKTGGTLGGLNDTIDDAAGSALDGLTGDS